MMNIEYIIDGLQQNNVDMTDKRGRYLRIKNINDKADNSTQPIIVPYASEDYRRIIGLNSENDLVVRAAEKTPDNKENVSKINLNSLKWKQKKDFDRSLESPLYVFKAVGSKSVIDALASIQLNNLSAKYTLEQFQTLSDIIGQIKTTYTQQALHDAWKAITKLIPRVSSKSSDEEKNAFNDKIASFKASYEKCVSVLNKISEIDFSNPDVPYINNDVLELIVTTINESNSKLDMLEKEALSDEKTKNSHVLIRGYINLLSEFLEKSKEKISNQNADDDQTAPDDDDADMYFDEETLKLFSAFNTATTEAAIKRPPNQTRADGNGPAAMVQRLMKEKNKSLEEALKELNIDFDVFGEDLILNRIDSAYVGGGTDQLEEANKKWERLVSNANTKLWTTVNNMRLTPVVDYDSRNQNNITNKRYVYDDKQREVLRYGFAETEKDSLGGSLLTALPYVNPRFLFINRNNQDSGDTEIKTRAYKNTKTSLNEDEAEAHVKHRAFIYTEAGFSNLMQSEELKQYPEFILHSMIYPPIANPENQSHVASDLERRFIKTKRMPLMMRIAARFVLLTSFSLQQMNKWYDNNIAIPLGGMVMRPWEEMTMYSQIALAEYQIGEFFFSGFDNLVSFDPSAQHFQVNEFFHGAPVVENDSIFIFAKDTRGGADKGGKGNRYINSRPDGQVLPLDPRLWDEYEQYNAELVEEARTVVDEHLYRGERLGNFSNIPVLQGYNTAIEKTTPLHFDIRGNWQPVDFAGRLEHSEEFMLTRPKPMYDGQFTVNYVLPLKKMRTDFDLHTLSHAQKTLLTRYNNHVHQTTFWVYDENQNEVEEKSHHPLGDEYPGYRDDQTSRNLIPASKANIRVY
jgi:hypothetical protein